MTGTAAQTPVMDVMEIRKRTARAVLTGMCYFVLQF